MINSIKLKIKDLDFPIGSRRRYNIKLPPEGYVYGLESKKDLEGVGASKNKKGIK